MLTLKGRTAFITGAAQGIGYAIAELYAKNGMKVIIADIAEEKAHKSAERLKRDGLKVCHVICDVTQVESISDAMCEAAKTFGGIDVLVNVAGVLSMASIEEMTLTEWNRVMGINLTGAFFAVQQALPWLEKSNHARIINISSNAGRMGGFEGSLVYGASKGGMIALTYGLARQLGPKKILVNCIAPGTTLTEIAKSYTPEAIKRLEARTTIGRLGLPEEVATAACYFASEEAGFVTGAVLDVNGGMFMG